MKTSRVLLVLAGVVVGGFLLAKTVGAKTGRKAPIVNGIAMGDVNGDGYVTQEDADLVGNYVVGNIQLSAEQLARAAVRGVKPINIFDAEYIKQYARGSREKFPVEG